MFKKFLWLAMLAAAGFFAWRFGYPAAVRHFFRATGTVSLAPGQASVIAPNSMLFVVARNRDGVPVAVKKTINPVFPLNFEMSAADLIMPDLLTQTLYFEALLNTHGQILDAKKGDLCGEQSSGVRSISRGIKIELRARIK